MKYWSLLSSNATMQNGGGKLLSPWVEKNWIWKGFNEQITQLFMTERYPESDMMDLEKTPHMIK